MPLQSLIRNAVWISRDLRILLISAKRIKGHSVQWSTERNREGVRVMQWWIRWQQVQANTTMIDMVTKQTCQSTESTVNDNTKRVQLIHAVCIFRVFNYSSTIYAVMSISNQRLWNQKLIRKIHAVCIYIYIFTVFNYAVASISNIRDYIKECK